MENGVTEEDKWTGRKRVRPRVSHCLCVFLLLFSGFLAWLFFGGPVHVPALAQFLASQVSKNGVEVSVADASLDFTFGDGILVVLRDAEVKVPGDVGTEVILPRIEAPVDISALLTGTISFSKLELERPRIILDLPEEQRALPAMGSLMEAVDRVGALIETDFTRRDLELVELHNGEVDFLGSLPRSIKGIDATIRRNPQEGLRAKATVAGRFGAWDLEMVRTSGADHNRRRLALLVRDITMGELLDPELDVKSGTGLGLPLSVRFESFFSENGEFESSNFVARMTEGWFQLGKTSVRFDDVAFALKWNAGDPSVEITPSHIKYRNTQLNFTGQAHPAAALDGTWDVDLGTSWAQFGSSDVSEQPIVVDDIEAKLNLDPKERLLKINQLALKAGNAELFGVGSVDLQEDGPYLAVAVEGKDLSVGLVKQVWPITITPPARRWIIDRVQDGLIGHFSLDAAIRPPAFNSADPDPGWAGNDLTMSMSFTGGKIDAIGEVPPIEDLDGTLKIENEVLTVDGVGGKAQAAEGGLVQLPEGQFKILHLREKDDKVGVIDLKLDGSARDIGWIFNQAPFGVLNRVDLSPDGLSGTGAVQMKAEFPLNRNLALDEVDWSAQAEFKGFSTSEPIRGHLVSKAAVTLNADRSHVEIQGTGQLDGLQADIDLLLPLEGSKVKARQGVVVSVSAKQLKERGIDLTSFLSGELQVTVSEDAGKQTYDIDMAKASIKLAALGWEKGSGVPAKVSFKLADADDKRVLQDLELVSEGVDISGTITLSSSGELEEATFSRFQLRAGDDAALTVRRGNAGRYRVNMTGSEFDARGLIRSLGKTKAEDDKIKDFSKGLVININLDRVVGFNNTRIDKFAGLVETSKAGLKSADLTGLVQGRTAFRFGVGDAGGTGVRTAEGEFDDAGAVLRFLDTYDRMRGGRGRLHATATKGDNWDGTVDITNLSITEDPAIRKLAERPDILRYRDQGAVVGNSNRPSNVNRGGEASFDTLNLAFSRDGETVTITRGALKGAVLGGTVSGTMNLSSQSLDLTGTFVPIYALNNIFANIPILGFALGGGSGEGLIGVTYRVTGPMSDPVLSVNPISAIAPGIFRKMFEFQGSQ